MTFPDPSERRAAGDQPPPSPRPAPDPGRGLRRRGARRSPAAEIPPGRSSGSKETPSWRPGPARRCARVLEGDLVEVLPQVAAGGERFDAVVFADVLEHLDEPVEALARARRVVKPGAAPRRQRPQRRPPFDRARSPPRPVRPGAVGPLRRGAPALVHARVAPGGDRRSGLAGSRRSRAKPVRSRPRPRPSRGSPKPGPTPTGRASRRTSGSRPRAPDESRVPPRVDRALRRSQGRAACRPRRWRAAATASRSFRRRRRRRGSALSRAHFERSSFSDSPALAAADVRVATFWKTAAPAVDGARGPVFHLCQGYEGQFSFYRDAWPEIEAAYRLPTRKLAVSGTLAARLDALGFGPAVDVGQAFDANGFAPGPERPPSDPPAVLVVGPTEVDLKGVGVALDGLALWRSRGGRFRLRRVSYFPCEEDERRRGLTDEYHHGLPPDRMPFAYRATDLFIGPSRAEEGFGLPALEALACGVPALLSDTPGHREMAGEAAAYFRDGERGEPRRGSAGAAHGGRPPARATRGTGGRPALRRGPRGRAAGGGVPRGAGEVVVSPRLSAIVVNHRSAAEAAACVASLREAFRRESIAGEIVLVDCASGPDEVRALGALPADARVFLEDNRGYSGGVNAGLARAGSDRLLLCNADVVFGDGALTALLAAIEDAAASARRRRSASGTPAAGCVSRPSRARRSSASSAWRPFPAFARRTLRLWKEGGDARHLVGRRARRPPRRLRPCRPLRRAVPVRVRGVRVGGPRPRRRPRPALRSARAGAPSLRPERRAQSRDRAPPRGLAPALSRAPLGRARGAGSSSGAPPGRGRPDGFPTDRRAGARRAGRRLGRRLDEPVVRSLRRRAARPGLPAAARRSSSRLRRGACTCAPSGRRTAGRSRPSSGRSRERLRGPRRDRGGRARHPAPLREGVRLGALGRGVALEVRAEPRRVVRRRRRGRRARSSATMPAGARASCSTGRSACSIPSATSRRIRRCAASAGAASTAR